MMEQPLVQRKMKPIRWLQGRYQIEALCYNSEPHVPKTFNVAKVKEISDRPKPKEPEKPAAAKLTPIRPNMLLILQDQIKKATEMITQFSIEKWLRTISMERYLAQFKEQGYDTYFSVRNLEEKDLDTIGVILHGHRKLLISHSVTKM